MTFQIGSKIHIIDKDNQEEDDGQITDISPHLTNPLLYDVDYVCENGHSGYKCVDCNGFCVHCNGRITEIN